MTSTIKVNNVQNQCGANIINENSNTITIGASGDTIALASGASQTGFGRTGTVDWQTGSIKTATFTAANGEGYFANTSGGAFTMNLPAGTAGNIVSVVDYTNTFQTNNLTITPNGSQKIGGANANAVLSTEGQSVTFVYVDDTEGWKNTMDSTSNAVGRTFLTATGGTITTSGDFKIHTFTSPGTFCVSSTATDAPNNVVDYLVVAGGGGGGHDNGAGGGAGGFRLSNDTCMPAPLTSPLANPTGLTATVASFPITVGGGGAGGTSPPGGTNGSNSVFSTITSAGGGAGAPTGQNGGSGGGASAVGNPAGTGNTPPVSPPQGNDGGLRPGDAPAYAGGGGGGAGAAGNNSTAPRGGAGGDGSYVLGTGFAGSNGTTGPVSDARYFSGGGGGGGQPYSPACGASNVGGAGGGGNAYAPAFAGGTNTGGGGGGGSSPSTGGAGGSGIVIIRYKFQ